MITIFVLVCLMILLICINGWIGPVKTIDKVNIILFIVFTIPILFLVSGLQRIQLQDKNMSVENAFNYVNELTNYCESSSPIINYRGKYCTYAKTIYQNAESQVQQTILQDPKIQALLAQAIGVDCNYSYPTSVEPAICIAIDMRADELEMTTIKKLKITSSIPIFKVHSKWLKPIFTNEYLNKITLEQESENRKNAELLLK